MKKSMLISAFLVFAMACFGQTVKKDTVPAKPVYEKFVKVPVDVFNQLTGALHDYKDQLIYNQLMTADEKVSTQVGISSYLFNLSKNSKVDSSLVVTPKIKK